LESVLPRMKDGRQALFLFLPEGEDPDSLVRKEGIAGFDAHLHAATPLSEFFFAHMSADVNLSSLDGKARLAERCKPLLAQIPDGAFGDLMQQRLAELTGLGARASAPQVHVPVQRPRGGSTSTQKPSLVRSAIQHIVHHPAFALELQPPDHFANARLPGVELLHELVLLIRERQEINTGALLEHFDGREEAISLQKLAAQELPGEKSILREVFLDAIKQLQKLVMQQRIDELQSKWAAVGVPSALNAEEHEELKLLQRDIRAL
jgi:DNA primase